MPSATTSFCLSFGGVEFRLDPKSFGTGIQMNHGSNNELLLELKNFTGALRVTKAEEQPQATADASSSQIIVDDPPSPKQSQAKLVSPQQKQLKFPVKKKAAKVIFVIVITVCVPVPFTSLIAFPFI